MPNYDTACSHCDYESLEQIKISDLVAWDLQASCPHCGDSAGAYRRVIRQGVAIRSGSKAAERSAQAKKNDNKERFVKSGERDDMLHRQVQKTDRHQIAEAREIVKSGKYEGF
ncbi:MAG: hypothetical protein NTX25_04605 [Proteobacteria bacterium]|nr:hypothetical protein [Pseudomonadota bacterium]